MFENWKRLMQAGEAALAMQDLQSARSNFEQAVKEAEKFGLNNLSLAESLEKLGQCLSAFGGPDYCEEDVQVSYDCFQRAAIAYEAAHGPQSIKVADCLLPLARITAWHVDLGEAEKMIRRVLAIYTDQRSTKITEAGEVLLGILALQDRGDESEEVIEDVLKVCQGLEDTEPAALATWTMRIAECSEDASEQERHLRNAIAIAESSAAATGVVTDARVRLGGVLSRTERFTAAEEEYRKAVEFGNCCPQVKSELLTHAFVELARISVYCRRDYADARKLLNEAKSLRDESAGGYDPVPAAEMFLAEMTGDLERLEQLCRDDLEEAKKAKGHDLVPSLREMRIGFSTNKLASCLYQRGRYAEAVSYWNKCAGQGDEFLNETAWVGMGLAHLKSANMESARECADLFMKQVDGNSDIFNITEAIVLEHGLGRGANMVHLIELADQSVAEMLERDPGDERRLISLNGLALGLALARIGKLQEAQSRLEAAFAAPGSDSIVQALRYEQIARKFEEADAHELAALLKDRASQIRMAVQPG